jgi:TRAP-type C4-dicarboxylate transport system permease small subunit
MFKYFDRFLENLNCGIYLLLIFVGFLQVFFRYVLNYSLSWTEEVGRYSFVWLTFVGAALCVRNDSHIGLDIMTTKLSRPKQFALLMLVDIGTMALLIFLIYQGGLITLKTTRQVSAALHIPMSVFYFSIPLGAFLMLVNTVRNFVTHIRMNQTIHKLE